MDIYTTGTGTNSKLNADDKALKLYNLTIIDRLKAHGVDVIPVKFQASSINYVFDYKLNNGSTLSSNLSLIHMYS